MGGQKERLCASQETQLGMKKNTGDRGKKEGRKRKNARSCPFAGEEATKQKTANHEKGGEVKRPNFWGKEQARGETSKEGKELRGSQIPAQAGKNRKNVLLSKDACLEKKRVPKRHLKKGGSGLRSGKKNCGNLENQEK